MNLVSRTLTGIFMIVLGLILIGVGIFVYFTLIYGIPLLIIGIFILLNSHEDDIERVKRKGGK